MKVMVCEPVIYIFYQEFRKKLFLYTIKNCSLKVPGKDIFDNIFLIFAFISI